MTLYGTIDYMLLHSHIDPKGGGAGLAGRSIYHSQVVKTSIWGFVGEI